MAVIAANVDCPAHEVLTVGTSPNDEVTHDAKGNITFLPTNLLTPARTLFWDFDNQLTGVDTTGDSTPDVTYQYDVLHRRVARVQGSADAVYVHAGNQVIAEYRLGGLPSVPQQRYVWGDYIDEPILKQSSGVGASTLYYHHNQQYSTVALTNTSGEVVERYAYTAYGEMLITDFAGTPRASTAHGNRYTYTGREWDDSTKLYYFRARWYEPVLGRFVTRDIIEFGSHVASYHAQIAVNHLDPSGLVPLFLPLSCFCKQVEGPRVVMISWIEDAPDLVMPGGGINWTANPRPPEALSDRAANDLAHRCRGTELPAITIRSFGAILASQEYRNIHVLSPRIKCCFGKVIEPSEFGDEQHVGFTPTPGTREIGRPIYVQGRSKEPTKSTELSRDKSCITFFSRQRFQVNFLENLGTGVAKPGNMLPYAWSEIFIRICCDGRVDVGFSGSMVPSYHAYIDDALIETYSMAGSTANDKLNRFWDAGVDEDGPERNLDETVPFGTCDGK